MTRDGWRTGDQRYYVSDTRRFQRATGWAPKQSVAEGVKLLYDWLSDSLQLGGRSAHGYERKSTRLRVWRRSDE